MEESNKDKIKRKVKVPSTSLMKEGGGYISDFPFSRFEIQRGNSIFLKE